MAVSLVGGGCLDDQFAPACECRGREAWWLCALECYGQTQQGLQFPGVFGITLQTRLYRFTVFDALETLGKNIFKGLHDGISWDK